jgi:hypothetical protein
MVNLLADGNHFRVDLLSEGGANRSLILAFCLNGPVRVVALSHHKQVVIWDTADQLLLATTFPASNSIE